MRNFSLAAPVVGVLGGVLGALVMADAGNPTAALWAGVSALWAAGALANELARR